MFIKNLTIKNNKKIIRNIDFKKGINLIVDETKKSDKTGNNVGKTTVLRLIDYCLGSSGKNIYTDTEFKENSGSIIESFLKDNNIIISLILVDNLDEKKEQKRLILERNFLNGSEKISRINNKQYNKIKEEYAPELSKLIFGYNGEKPTFRQIISKNIRYEKNRLKHTLRVLHSTTKSEEYESVYLFWLGIFSESFSEKQIKELEEKKEKSFEIGEDYDSDLGKLQEIKSKINKLSTEFTQLNLRRELILESKINLENEKSPINLENIKRFYDEAKLLIPNIQKSFEETVDFHNQMISEKIEYLSKELPDLKDRISNLNVEIISLTREEKNFNKKIKVCNAYCGIGGNTNVSYFSK